MEKDKRSQEDLRFFKVEIKLDSKEVLRTSIDLETVVSINMNYDDSISASTLGGIVRLPCSEKDVTYSYDENIATFKALEERWISYKMSK